MRLTQTVPAMPVRDARTAAASYRQRIGFAIQYEHEGFAKLQRDDAELHLWQADHEGWRSRDDLV